MEYDSFTAYPEYLAQKNKKRAERRAIIELVALFIIGAAAWYGAFKFVEYLNG